jgi:hypothetical protein
MILFSIVFDKNQHNYHSESTFCGMYQKVVILRFPPPTKLNWAVFLLKCEAEILQRFIWVFSKTKKIQSNSQPPYDYRISIKTWRHSSLISCYSLGLHSGAKRANQKERYFIDRQTFTLLTFCRLTTYKYICRTAPLTSRRYILNIYSTNIRTEYFKHAA